VKLKSFSSFYAEFLVYAIRASEIKLLESELQSRSQTQCFLTDVLKAPLCVKRIWQ